MSSGHKWAVYGAVVTAVLLLVGMLLGKDWMLTDLIAVNRSVRDVAIALWAFLLPAWFTFEEYWAPNSEQEPEKAAKFRKDQQYARYGWSVLGFAIAAIVIGATAPEPTRGASEQNPPAASSTKPQ